MDIIFNWQTIIENDVHRKNINKNMELWINDKNIKKKHCLLFPYFFWSVYSHNKSLLYFCRKGFQPVQLLYLPMQKITSITCFLSWSNQRKVIDISNIKRTIKAYTNEYTITTRTTLSSFNRHDKEKRWKIHIGPLNSI